MKTFIPNRRSIDFCLDMRLCRRRKKPSAEETKSIQSALAQLGCGESVKESSGLFEIDDAKCKIDFAYCQSD